MRLDLHQQLLLIEAALALAVARLVLAFIPFRRIASKLGAPHAESPAELTIAQAVVARQIGWAIGALSRHVFWECTCLTRAIAAQFLLKCSRIPCTLYLGLAKNDALELVAHAWVRSGHTVLAGAPNHEQFTVVLSFAAE